MSGATTWPPAAAQTHPSQVRGATHGGATGGSGVVLEEKLILELILRDIVTNNVAAYLPLICEEYLLTAKLPALASPK
ncbi:hypothetical protein FAGKG844_190037 [Frankia sp. AgKG'84/4]